MMKKSAALRLPVTNLSGYNYLRVKGGPFRISDFCDKKSLIENKDNPAMASYTVTQLAKSVGVSPQLVRWYEKEGLLPAAARSAKGYRLFDEHARKRLEFIRHARALDFSLDDIRALLSLIDDPDAPCAKADALARRVRNNVRKQIAGLQALDEELSRMIAECPSQSVRTCRVLEILADHGQCLHAEHPEVREDFPPRKRRKA